MEYTQDKLNALQKATIVARQNRDGCRRAYKLAEEEVQKCDEAMDAFIVGWRKTLSAKD